MACSTASSFSTGRYGQLQQSLEEILSEASRDECERFNATNAERVYRL